MLEHALRLRYTYTMLEPTAYLTCTVHSQACFTHTAANVATVSPPVVAIFLFIARVRFAAAAVATLVESLHSALLRIYAHKLFAVCRQCETCFFFCFASF